MLAIIACLVGIFALFVLAELFSKYRVLKGEYNRKFFHITAGSFIAFWPWLISWRAIQTLSVLMFLVMLAGRYRNLFSYNGHVHRVTYGDIFLALAILLCSFISHSKIFFAVAILQVALADGFAAVVGITYGKHWYYKVLGHKKTLVGSMVFWLVSICIFGIGLLAAHNVFSFGQYYLMLLLLPPALTLIENASVFGLDNLLIPILTIAILRFVQA